jgi:hypothetical protein
MNNQNRTDTAKRWDRAGVNPPPKAPKPSSPPPAQKTGGSGKGK